MPSQILIDQESHWPQIAVKISNFDSASEYYLDIGDGSRIRLLTPNQVLEYHESRVVLLKLLKDDILIDALEVIVEVNGKVAAKLVSY
jgi:hypothetical protein